MDLAREFFEAVKAGDQPQAEALLDREPGLLNARTPEDWSPVLLATYYDEPGIASLLIERGVVLDIFEASAAGQTSRVRDLLYEDQDRVNQFAPDGFQPLGLAAFFGHLDTVVLLLEKGAQVNSASRNSQQVMPLHSAVAARHHEIARRLLEAGADVDAQQRDGFTPLQEAAHNGQIEMAGLILGYGPDTSARNANGKTALALAEEMGHQPMVDFLQKQDIKE